MSRPALGKFLYQKYLNHGSRLSAAQSIGLNRRLTARLGPRQLVNSFYRAIRENDAGYLECIADPDVIMSVHKYFHMMHQLLEGQVEEVFASRSFARGNTRWFHESATVSGKVSRSPKNQRRKLLISLLNRPQGRIENFLI
jgi:hypothetical protein